MAKRDNSKQIAEYTLDAWNRAQTYKANVESGALVTGEWVKLAVARSRSDAQRTDIYFNRKAAERALEFFYFCNIPGGHGYQRFVLSPYQAWIVTELFGWYVTERKNKRRFRYAVIYTARKTGKTVFSVCLEKLVLLYDRQERPEAYLMATNRDQANQALDYSKAIVKNSPALNRRLKVQQWQILYPKRLGKLKVVPYTPDKLDSLNPAVFIIDEMHAHPTLAGLNVMKSGTLNRPNPLGIITSTAGFNKDYPFFTMVETGKKVLQGIVTDDITFYALYTLDDDDEIEDFDSWIKANPNIGVTVDLLDLVAEYKKAKLTVSELNNFITKNLNRYLDNLEQWIPDDIYIQCFKPTPEPVNRPLAYMGIDLASTRDMASLVIVWTDEATGLMCVKPEFYFPQNDQTRVRDSGIDLGEWIEKGYIIEHNKHSIDHEAIVERIKYYNTIFDIQQINYDSWNSAFIIPKVETELFIYCKPFIQDTKWFNFPLKYIERLFFDEQIFMGLNPVMRWMFRNIVLYYDGNGNIKIMKNKSRDSVDGPVSLGMAVGAWLEANGDATAAFFKELMAARDKPEAPPAA